MLKRLFLLVLLLTAVTGATGSEGRVPLSAAEKAELLAFSSSAANTSLRDLPRTIRALCADNKGRLAAPGEPWESTDVISDDSLPRVRLIWHATVEDRTLVHYETGGYSHSFWLLVVETKASPRTQWLATSSVALRGPSDLSQAIEQAAIFSARP